MAVEILGAIGLNHVKIMVKGPFLVKNLGAFCKNFGALCVLAQPPRNIS